MLMTWRLEAQVMLRSSADLLAAPVPDHRHRRARLAALAVGPAARGLVGRRAVRLARVLHRDPDAELVVADQRAAGLRGDRHGEELAYVAALLALDRHHEQAVVGAERVAVGGDPQIAVGVEGHVVRAGDRRHLLLVEPG